MSVRRNFADQKTAKTIGMAVLLSALLTSGPFMATSFADEAGALLGSLHDADVLVQPEIVRKIETMGETAVPSLLDAMDSGDTRLRHQAIEILGRIGKRANAATPQLIDALTDDEAQIRRNAAWALGRVGEDASAAMPTLLDTATDIRWDVRADAVWAMGRVVEDSGEWTAVNSHLVETVMDYLQDESHHVRWSAAWSLARFGPGADIAVQSLVDSLEDHHYKVRASAASALGRVASSHHEDMAAEALTKASKDENSLVRTRAEAALRALRARNVPSF